MRTFSGWKVKKILWSCCTDVNVTYEPGGKATTALTTSLLFTILEWPEIQNKMKYHHKLAARVVCFDLATRILDQKVTRPWHLAFSYHSYCCTHQRTLWVRWKDYMGRSQLKSRRVVYAWTRCILYRNRKAANHRWPP